MSAWHHAHHQRAVEISAGGHQNADTQKCSAAHHPRPDRGKMMILLTSLLLHHDAEHSPLVAKWAGGIRKQFLNLGMATPIPGGVVGTVDVLAFRRALLSQEVSVWQGLRMSPRVAPSPRAKLCTYCRWFARVGLIECLWSRIMNCPCLSQSSDCCFSSGRALIRCRLSKTGLQGQACEDIYVAAHFVPVGPWVVSGTAFLSVRVLMATG